MVLQPIDAKVILLRYWWRESITCSITINPSSATIQNNQIMKQLDHIVHKQQHIQMQIVMIIMLMLILIYSRRH